MFIVCVSFVVDFGFCLFVLVFGVLLVCTCLLGLFSCLCWSSCLFVYLLVAWLCRFRLFILFAWVVDLCLDYLFGDLIEVTVVWIWCFISWVACFILHSEFGLLFRCARMVGSIGVGLYLRLWASNFDFLFVWFCLEWVWWLFTWCLRIGIWYLLVLRFWFV